MQVDFLIIYIPTNRKIMYIRVYIGKKEGGGQVPGLGREWLHVAPHQGGAGGAGARRAARGSGSRSRGSAAGLARTGAVGRSPASSTRSEDVLPCESSARASPGRTLTLPRRHPLCPLRSIIDHYEKGRAAVSQVVWAQFAADPRTQAHAERGGQLRWALRLCHCRDGGRGIWQGEDPRGSVRTGDDACMALCCTSPGTEARSRAPVCPCMRAFCIYEEVINCARVGASAAATPS